jgi:two-component sensor histidine kinase
MLAQLPKRLIQAWLMKKTGNSPMLDRIVSWSLDYPVGTPIQVAVATALIILIAVARVLLVTTAIPWLLFIPAIFGLALIFGIGVGLYASFLSTIAAALTIGSVNQPFFLTAPQWSGSVLFLLVAVVLARVVGEVRAALRRARDLNAELTNRQAFLSSVLASSTDCMKVMEVSDFNDVKGCPWPDFWQDAGNAEAREAIASAKLGQASHFSGKADTFAGTPKWWDVSISPIMGPDGKPDRILAVSRDMTPLFEAQEQQQLLNGELGHRLKNVLALVQSIANQTFRQADGIEEANATFAARLSALGKATDVLTTSAWQSAEMHDVVKAGLASFGGMAERIETQGPSMKIDSQMALALTLALHELTTNACKYGALSSNRGKVSLTWYNNPVENSADTRFSLQWQETGGPPVAPPSSRGFGSKMIERSLRSYFRGETSLEFPPEGVLFRIDAPLPSSGAGPS